MALPPPARTILGRARRAPLADPVGVAGEDRDLEGLVDGVGPGRRGRAAVGQALELAGGAIDLVGGGGVEAERAQAIAAQAGLAGGEHGVEVVEQVRRRRDPRGGPAARAAPAAEPLLEPDPAGAQRRGHDRALGRDPAALGLDQEAGLARVGREPQHAPAGVGERAAVERAQPAEQVLGGADRGVGRRLEPGGRIERRDPGGVELERGLGEVGARDLGRIVRRAGCRGRAG